MIAQGPAERYPAARSRSLSYRVPVQVGLGCMLLACAFAAFLVAAPDPAHVRIDVWAARGSAWSGLGWLGSRTAAWLSGFGGTQSLVVATALSSGFAFLFVAWRAQRRSDGCGALLALGCLALTSLDAFRAGSGISNLLFAAGLLLILERPSLATALAATLLAVLWCNVSAQGAFAPLLAGAYALGLTLRDGSTANGTRLAWLAALGCAAALFATPALLGYPHAAFAALRVDRALAAFVPMHPIDVAPLAYRIGFPAVVIGAFALGGALDVADVPLLACALGLALCNGAYLPLLGVVAGPAFAAALRGRVPMIAAAACATAACAVIAF